MLKAKYIYLGGNHRESENWRRDFQLLADNICGPGKIKGIDPFERNIDESDHKQIVERDIGIILDPRVTHVILQSVSHGAELTTGSACEFMVAATINKPTIILCDKRKLQKPIWTHPFILYFATAVVESLEEAIQVIKLKNLPTQGKKLLQPANQLENIKKKFQLTESDIDPFI